MPAGTASIPKPTLAKGDAGAGLCPWVQAAWVTGDTIYGGGLQTAQLAGGTPATLCASDPEEPADRSDSSCR